MATPEELIEQYKVDPALQKEIYEILKDNKISMKEFLEFTRKHDLKLSLTELPGIVKKAKEMGLIK